ncbi:ARM REPEAT PROTEIN INTERACTING WITH ABF2 [Tetrabaena socialis]|uniref:ARM REPEAT PROTEIN INTERACTING WITH ABF2 n=1 Tax=Tetrabaena socialis TaxID=47790 RepID=A0A2J8ADX5_9CHLO|nr:ARM REPEAT PROTEIN INTERACTING WITH ABF2 [Tetrabaena socialis]|eukprot:PNH10714.1 ARM REPEAT PROTEIN INTERACTING WITH ABF2 [Tetrabaena socialis]
MTFLHCKIHADSVFHGTVSRVLPGPAPGEAASIQTLVACGRTLRPLTGADALGGLELGPPLQLYAEAAARDGEPAAARRPYIPATPLLDPVWDPFTSTVYMREGSAIVRLSSDDTVTVVAGDVEELGNTDGPGQAARFIEARFLASDGVGSLYVVDRVRIRKVQLPGVGPGTWAAQAGVSPGGQAAGAAAAEGEALVSTLPLVAPSGIWGLAFDSSSSSTGSSGICGSLLFATKTALYRLQLGDPIATPLLLAGAEGMQGVANGRGAEARFDCIGIGIVLDGLKGAMGSPAILPNGCLSLCTYGIRSLYVLGLVLKLPAHHAAAAALPSAAGPLPRTLPADLGALLDRQPDGTADVAIVVGDRTYHVHRVLLSARSDYFQQRFSSGFADGSAQQLSLPDADPDAFELWLRFVYTGAADIKAAQAAGVAELADRLLLPELREQAMAVVEASVSAGTVAGLLLWAEARGPAFSELLSRLKAWYVENHEAVMREAEEEFLHCNIRADSRSYGAVTRVLPGARPGEAASIQTLVACGRALRPLSGADSLGGLELGPPLQLYAEAAARDGEPAATRRPHITSRPFVDPVWDPFSSAVYVREGHAVLRLSSDDTVTVVAGDVEEAGDADGPGQTAQFDEPRFLASDGAGSLYVATGDLIRKVQLPGVGPGTGAAQAGAPPGGQAAGAAAVEGGEAMVSTLLHRAPSKIWGLAFDGGGSSSSGGNGNSCCSLLFATGTALYRLPLGDPTTAPLLLAGTDGTQGAADGRGAEARFSDICGIVLDGEGSLYVADCGEGDGEDEGEDEEMTSLRQVAADGTVTTISAGLKGLIGWPFILPNGCLLFSCMDGEPGLYELYLGMKLPACHAGTAASPAVPTGPLPRTLPAVLGALLDRQPDGTADVTIVVGGRTFHAHRVLLSARSDYFRQRLGGDFADGSAQQLSLPDADPDAFELWLRFVYTGAADIPAAQAAGVAELTDRLLLPELREQAMAVVEASVSAGTVAGLLLWAEGRGPAFSELLSRLKAWYVANHEAVMREAEEEVRLLSSRSPSLFFELVQRIAGRDLGYYGLLCGDCTVRVLDSPLSHVHWPSAVSRVLPGAGPGEAPSVQTLVPCGCALRPLMGADAFGNLELGPPLQLYTDPAARDDAPAAARRPYIPAAPFTDPVWDSCTSAVYILLGHAVVRLSSDDTVTVVAGDVDEEGNTDGLGRAARFGDLPQFLASDGAGSLYLAEFDRIRKVQLPDVGLGTGAAQVVGPPGDHAAGAAVAEGEALVSTLPLVGPNHFWGMAFDGGSSSSGGSGSLLFATGTALYQLPLDDPTVAPLLLAGAEGVEGIVDGRGVEARFSDIDSIVLDGEGSLYVTEGVGEGPEETTTLRRVAADGAVTTVVTGLKGRMSRPSILPNGCLAFCVDPGHTINVLVLGLKPRAWHTAAAAPTPAAPAGPPPRTLPADLGALLDRQPDGTADVVIVVGDRTFHAHRVLLSARSDYFQQRFSSDFAEASAQQLSLPDADPDAFELWLHFVYTGAADFTAAQAAGVAELADRLLLPELREQAAAVVEASVSASTVVGLLLWAEGLGPAFSGLLSRLKAWYVENHEEVMRESEEEVKLLMHGDGARPAPRRGARAHGPWTYSASRALRPAACPPASASHARRGAGHDVVVAEGDDNGFFGAVSRVLPGSRLGEAASVQTLVVCGLALRPLSGADVLSGLEMGPPLQLYAEAAGGPAAARRPYGSNHLFESPVWDPCTLAVYMLIGNAIMRLSSDDTLAVVAGDVREEGDADGPGRAARFKRELKSLASDGAGSLYMTEGNRIRKVQLPGVGPGTAGAQAGAPPGGQAAGAAAAEGETMVSTLPLRAPSEIWGLAFDGGSSSSGVGCGSLLFATCTALYRLPLGDPTAAPSLLAGAEGTRGIADGRGAGARFSDIDSIVLDGEGSLYVADYGGREEGEGTTTLRRVAVDGAVTTVTAGLKGTMGSPAILPNGCLSFVWYDHTLYVLVLGLKLPAWHAAAAAPPPAAPSGPRPRTLPADLGALLDRQPDGTADVTIVVGDRMFHAHRLLLSARSDYFQQRLGGGFVEGSAQQLSLPDADPDAFELWLRFVYTGAADIPAAQAACVAELADRLLLPELREQAAAVVEASVSTGTVVGLLLWAEGRGPAFSELLSRLKAWYVENHEEVMREAKEEVKLLMACSPDLMFELMHARQVNAPAPLLA